MTCAGTIKEDPERGNIPVVMITSLQNRKERTKGIEAGAEDFISKPIDQGEVLARIRMLLQMKELNERLGQAYASVTGLAAFGAETLKSFDPQDFELMPQIDRLVGQIIRQSGETIDRPPGVVVSVRAARAGNGIYYEAPFRELTPARIRSRCPGFPAASRQGRADVLLCQPLRIRRPRGWRRSSPAWNPTRCCRPP